jgi:hypothetical protein
MPRSRNSSSRIAAMIDTIFIRVAYSRARVAQKFDERGATIRRLSSCKGAMACGRRRRLLRSGGVRPLHPNQPGRWALPNNETLRRPRGGLSHPILRSYALASA